MSIQSPFTATEEWTLFWMFVSIGIVALVTAILYPEEW